MRTVLLVSIAVIVMAAAWLAFPVNAGPLPMQQGAYDDRSPHFIYTGSGWSQQTGAGWFSSTFMYSENDNARYWFRFYGTGFHLQFATCSSCADFFISISTLPPGAICEPACPPDEYLIDASLPGATYQNTFEWYSGNNESQFWYVEARKSGDFFGGATDSMSSDAVFIIGGSVAFPTLAPIEITLPPFPTAEPPAWIHQYELDGVPVAYEYSASTGEIAIAMTTGGVLIVSIVALLVYLWGKR